MNKAFFVGSLCTDPIPTYTKDGSGEIALVKYTLAVPRAMDKEKNKNTDFIPVVAFTNRGKFALAWFKKGMRVAVTGELRSGVYSTKEGEKKYTLEVMASEQEFADGRDKTGEHHEFMDIPAGADEGVAFN